MDTSAGYYQAPRPPRVPLDEVLIKLHPEGFNQAFEADGIDVGAGGLSMRASVLPEVGSTLRCQLDNPTGGDAMELVGRVVWAHESGPRVGEFGIRFTELTSQDQLRLEALIQRWGRTTAKAPLVRLQLDGVDAAIVAEVQSKTDDTLCVEQPLPFLAIGSPISDESTGRRGHLEAVELRMDDATPKLVLSIGYETSDAAGAAEGAQSDRDTLPEDLPSGVRIVAPSAEQKLQDTPRIVRYDPETDDVPARSLVQSFRAQARLVVDWGARIAQEARATVTGRFVPWVTTSVAEGVALVRRFIAALRERLDDKPRRKQVPRSRAARAHLKNTRRQRRRYVVLLATVAGIVTAGWGIYVWAASSTGGAAAETDAPAPTPEGAAAQTVETPVAAPAIEAADEATAEQAAPELQGAPLPPKPVRGSAFGAETVKRGEKYVLRMSNPVLEMDGIVEDDGFSVTIPGSLSLSRAGPIATAHPDVEHASILNRGDFSELTVRFVAGRRPDYRVEARGPAIEITVAR